MSPDTGRRDLNPSDPAAVPERVPTAAKDPFRHGANSGVMSERTDEVERDADEAEAQAAIEEAQAVLDDVEASTGTGDSGGILGGTSRSGSESRSEAAAEESSGGLLPSFSLPSPSVPSLSELFSTRYFGVALVAAAVAMFGGALVIPFFDRLGGYAALFVVTFLMGALSSKRHYLETVLASVLVTGGLSFFGNLRRAALFDGFNFGLVLVLAVGIGFVVSLVGTYMGRDLRAGLTRDVGGGGGAGGAGGEDPPEW
jgi:hypothetical protein